MRRKTAVALVAVVLAGSICVQLASPPPARAGLSGLACKVLGTIGEGWWGTACNTALDVGGKLVSGGKKAAGVISKVAGNPLIQRAAGIAAIGAWVLGGAKWTIDHMATVISSTTSPALTATWFMGVYLRVEALALFFTLLFLCAAAAEALLRSDAALLARAAFVYLPLAALLTALATPLTMLLLATTDQLSAGFAGVAGQGTTHFLTGTSAWVAAGLTAADPFFAVIAGGVVVAAGGALWVEMLIREVAVYVVVAMLPLVFASMVWPARRVWAIRSTEILISLILSKVAVVVVLALGGAALGHSGAGGISKLLGGLALIILGAFSPWLLLRLIPVAEVAAAAVGHVRGHVHATAGIRTPEAALASRTTERFAGDRRNGASEPADMAGVIAVHELLEQMQHRANTAQQPSAEQGMAKPSATSVAAPTRPLKYNARNESGSRESEPPGPPSGQPPATGARVPAEEQQTMVQRQDGTWEPLPHTDPNEPIPPPPWEDPAQPSEGDAEAEAPAPPAPAPDPQDGRLTGGEDDAA